MEEIIKRILIPFKEEIKRGADNQSVIGGFNKYVLMWIEKLNYTSPKIENIKKGFKKYTTLNTSARKKLIKATYLELINLKKELPKKLKISPHEESKRNIIEKLSLQGKLKPLPLDASVENISGVGKRTSHLLKKMGLYTLENLIYHIPREYQERHITTPDKAVEGKSMAIYGTLGDIKSKKVKGMWITKAPLYDKNGSITLVWFNQKFKERSLKPNQKYLAWGYIERRYGYLQMQNPEMELTENPKDEIVPIYSTTEGLSQHFLRKIVRQGLARCVENIEDPLPEEITSSLKLINLKDALWTLHFPESMEDVKQAQYRLRFDEAFYTQILLAQHRHKVKQEKKHRYTAVTESLEEFKRNLPFSLTNSQNIVLEEIIEDMLSPRPMNRLLQGDVGAGKTIIAILCTLLASRSGYQSAILAPTEVLAEQHFYKFKKMLKIYGIDVHLLIGDVSSSKKKSLKEKIRQGEASVIVGTHALLQEDVEFKNLAFVLVDEQQRFGVFQRASLRKKGRGADFLYTTATPIPRSLCLTLYGDLDISLLKELPPNRKPIKTHLVLESQKEKVYKFIEKELKKGNRAYVICPLIEESEKIDATPLLEEYNRLKNRFPMFDISLLHGRMKREEKEKVMEAFAHGKTSILVSTTVVEVGVDIPEATVMVILDADRYGLSQIHQIRGRVGRGDRESHCFLVVNNLKGKAKERLNILLKHTDGFEIAKYDLEMRGPGEFIGSKQSGIPDFKFLNLVRDYDIIMKAREVAFNLVKKEPELSGEKYRKIRSVLYKKYKKIWEIMH